MGKKVKVQSALVRWIEEGLPTEEKTVMAVEQSGVTSDVQKQTEKRSVKRAKKQAK